METALYAASSAADWMELRTRTVRVFPNFVRFVTSPPPLSRRCKKLQRRQEGQVEGPR